MWSLKPKPNCVESHTVEGWPQPKLTESREFKDTEFGIFTIASFNSMELQGFNVIEFGNISTRSGVRIAAYFSPVDNFLICAFPNSEVNCVMAV